jgi:superfamily II DNA or RNA helicase
MEKRKYQDNSVVEIWKRLEANGRVVAVGPTGCGKTVIGVKLVRRILRDFPASRILWLAHRIELLQQAFDELAAAGIPARDLGILSGAKKSNRLARVLVASVDMFRARDVPECDLMVIDEAHRVLAPTYQEIVAFSRKRWVLGLTASPWRLDGKGLGDVFSDMYVIAGPTELIVDGYIARPVSFGISREKARALVAGVRTQAGDYSQADLAKAMTKQPLMGDVVSECARLAAGMPTIVFAINREHGRLLAERFKRADQAVEYLDSETSANERAAMVGRHGRLASGETQVVVNVDVLSEGYDCPAVKCVSLARPTRSLTRFLQQTGRASRPYKGKQPIILDHAGNCHRFGLPEWEREWSLDDRPKRSEGSLAIVKQCTACDAFIAANARVCPQCGVAQPWSDGEIVERKARLEVLAANRAEKKRILTTLLGIARSKGVGEEWARSVAEQMLGSPP